MQKIITKVLASSTDSLNENATSAQTYLESLEMRQKFDPNSFLDVETPLTEAVKKDRSIINLLC